MMQVQNGALLRLLQESAAFRQSVGQVFADISPSRCLSLRMAIACMCMGLLHNNALNDSLVTPQP